MRAGLADLGVEHRGVEGLGPVHVGHVELEPAHRVGAARIAAAGGREAGVDVQGEHGLFGVGVEGRRTVVVDDQPAAGVLAEQGRAAQPVASGGMAGGQSGEAPQAVGGGQRAADVIWADDFAAGCQFREPLSEPDYDLLLARAAA